MLRRPNHIAPNLGPIDAPIQLLVHPSAHGHRVPADDVQAELDLLRGDVVLGVVGPRPDDALDRRREHQVHAAVAGLQGANHGAAVEGEDRDFFCGRRWMGGCGKR